MKITVYTIKECAFSKQEKEYLIANKLTYEEKDLETNKDFLTEMLAVSNNFAGTPVTRVEKDDGTIAVLKGFTKEEFDTTFGFSAAPTTPTTTTSTVEPTQAEQTPPPPTSTPAPVETTPPVEQSVEPKSDELNSVLDKLEENSTPEAVVPPSPPITDLTDSTVSTTPDPAVPSIPDFPDATKTTP
jgi:glutaredoxin